MLREVIENISKCFRVIDVPLQGTVRIQNRTAEIVSSMDFLKASAELAKYTIPMGFKAGLIGGIPFASAVYLVNEGCDIRYLGLCVVAGPLVGVVLGVFGSVPFAYCVFIWVLPEIDKQCNEAKKLLPYLKGIQQEIADI